MDVHMVLVGAATTPLAHLSNHAAGDEISGRKVFLMRRIALHEFLARRVGQVGALAACAFGYEDAGSENSRRWNCTNSMSWSGRPARSTMALPSPVQLWALVHQKYARRIRRSPGSSSWLGNDGSSRPRGRGLQHRRSDRRRPSSDRGQNTPRKTRHPCRGTARKGCGAWRTGAIGGGAAAPNRRTLAIVAVVPAERALVDPAVVRT